MKSVTRFLGVDLGSGDSSEDEDYVPTDAESDEEDAVDLEPDDGLIDFDADVIYQQFREALASGEPVFGMDDDEEEYCPAPGETRGKPGCARGPPWRDRARKRLSGPPLAPWPPP